MARCSSDENGEEYTDEPCTICGDPFTYATDKFISCNTCGVGFHQSCYGLQNKKMKTNPCFTCYYCMQLGHKTKKNTLCALCSVSKKGLALTTMDDNDGAWCHVICAYSFNCIWNPKSGNVTIHHSKDMQCNAKGTCDGCHASAGYKLECIHPECCNKIHPSCARINRNNNDDSFYFDDIYNDTIYRNPLYFCAQHNIKSTHQDAIQRKQAAHFMIQKWNQHKNTRKRKRETSVSGSPNAKKRKLSRRYVLCSEDEDIDHESSNLAQEADHSSEYSPTVDMESDDGLMIPTTPEPEEATSNSTSSDSEFSLDLMSPRPDTTNHATRYSKRAKRKSSYSGSKIANVHDFTYCMDKCYCFKCLKKQVIIKQEPMENEDTKNENEDEEEDTKWFNDPVWFNRDYTLRDFNINDKQSFTANCCDNIDITADYSPVYNSENDDANEDGTIRHALNGFESVSVYNYSAIHDNKEDEMPIPSKPFRRMNGSSANKKKSKRKKNNGTKPGSLFYRTIYRDIWLNCGGCVIAMDFNPISKYHNLNAFNYLAVFADCYNKYHAPSRDANDRKPHLIQVWKIKKRVSRKSSQKANKRGWCKAGAKHKNAVFHYGIVHSGGFIWDLKWLNFRINHKPSEPDHEYQRLGILAVCSEDNFVHIYSLPFTVKDAVLMDIKPVIKLSVAKETFIRLSWSSNLLFPMLIASSTNGCVAIWDLSVMTEKVDVCTCVTATDQHLNLIACHSPNEKITAIDWCSDHSNYFMTVSQNGCLRLWDVNHPYTPVLSRKLLNGLCTDIAWIAGMDTALLTTESSAPNNSATDCCTKLASIWPQQYLESVNNDKNKNMDSLPTAASNYSRMGSVIQFPAERLYNISDKVAFSVDVLLKCDCNNHDNESHALVSSENVSLYVVIGYSSGNVILYQHTLNQLANICKKANAQIVSQLIWNDDDDDNDKNVCRFVAPFYGINSNVYRNQFNVSRDAWTKQNKDKPIYDPYSMNPKQLALNDNVAIRKVKLCPNGDNLEVVSGSISGIIRIQTVQS